MKTLLFTTLCFLNLLLCSANAKADARDDLEQMVRANMKRAGCADSFSVAIAHKYGITRKIDNHHYEMVGEVNGVIFHAILETKKTRFESTGAPRGILMQYVGVKNMGLENGFSTKVDLWKECFTRTVRQSE